MRLGQGRFHRDEEGQSIVLIAASFLTLIFALALVVNAAMLFIARREAQEVADAAAMAGATSLYLGDSSAIATAVAFLAAEKNGYEASQIVVVTPYQGSATTVEVTATKPTDSLLWSDWGLFDVSARAVAGLPTSPSGLAIHSLGETAPALIVRNNGTLKISISGSIPAGQTTRAKVNSTHARAAWNQGGPVIICEQPFDPIDGSCPPGSTPAPGDTRILVRGGTFTSGGGTWPNTQANASFDTQDPYLTFAPPSPAGGTNWCRIDNFGSPDPVTGLQMNCNVYTAATMPACPGPLLPGQYTTTISGNCDWQMRPGVYVFKGNQAGINNPNKLDVLTRASSGNPMSGGTDGVFLVFTFSTYPTVPASQVQCAQLSLAGNLTWSLRAETEGPYTGFLIYYESRTLPNGNPVCQSPTISVGGTSQFNVATGLVYARWATVNLSGANPSAKLSQVVAELIDVGNGTLTLEVDVDSPGARGRPRLQE